MITLCRLDDNDDLIFSVNNDEEKTSNEDIKYITKIIDCIIQLWSYQQLKLIYNESFLEFHSFFVRTVPDDDVINFIITFIHTSGRWVIQDLSLNCYTVCNNDAYTLLNLLQFKFQTIIVGCNLFSDTKVVTTHKYFWNTIFRHLTSGLVTSLNSAYIKLRVFDDYGVHIKLYLLLSFDSSSDYSDSDYSLFSDSESIPDSYIILPMTNMYSMIIDVVL